MKSPAELSNLAEAIPAGSNIRLTISLRSLYFSAETKCKLSVKVERIQLIEAGSDVAEVENYSFEWLNLRVIVMVRTRSQFKLDVAAHKQQSIFTNTNNSLTGSSAASAGAIHHAAIVPPNMPMVRPRAHSTMKKSGKRKYPAGIFKAHLKNAALGRKSYLHGRSKKGGRKKSGKKYVRHHKHKTCARRGLTASAHTTNKAF